MGLRYLIFMGRNVESEKKLTMVQIMTGVELNSKNVVNSVSVFNGSVIINNMSRELYWDEQCFLRIFVG
jgi:hypothetical protein